MNWFQMKTAHKKAPTKSGPKNRTTRLFYFQHRVESSVRIKFDFFIIRVLLPLAVNHKTVAISSRVEFHFCLPYSTLSHPLHNRRLRLPVVEVTGYLNRTCTRIKSYKHHRAVDLRNAVIVAQLLIEARLPLHFFKRLNFFIGYLNLIGFPKYLFLGAVKQE